MTTQSNAIGDVAARDSSSGRPSKLAHRTGLTLTVLFAVFMTMDAGIHLACPQPVVEAMQKLNFPVSLAVPLGIVQLVCIVLYVVPRTAILGAILEVAYLGGAVAEQVRIGGPFFFPILMGVVAWGGLYLRDERLRSLMPLRDN
jgi:hypothetical protein